MTKTVAEIEGMSCGMCEAHINDVVRRSFDIKRIKSSYRKNQAEIISETPIDEKELRKVIEDTGYKLVRVQCEEYLNECLC